MVIAVGCPALGLCFKVRVATFQGQASACGGEFATTRLTRSETTQHDPRALKPGEPTNDFPVSIQGTAVRVACFIHFALRELYDRSEITSKHSSCESSDQETPKP